LWLGLTTALLAQPAPARALQLAEAPEGSDIARRIERRFEVLPLRDGVALRPRTEMPGIRTIEISGGSVAIEGSPVTGAELREKVGEDLAAAILKLSYMSAAEQRALFTKVPEISSTPAPTPEQDRPRTRGRNISNDRIRIFDSVVVEAGEVINGNAVAIAGSAEINGEVQDDVVAVGGDVTLGPQARVGRDVVVVGGRLKRDPGAQVGGDVKEVGYGIVGADRYRPPSWFGSWWQRGFGSAFALASTLFRLALLCLFAALVVLFASGYVDRVGARARVEPLKAGVIGLLSQLLFLPLLIVTIAVLLVTVIGIPLLLFIPFLVIGLAVVGLIGFTAVSKDLGKWTAQRFSLGDIGPFATTLLGILTLLSPVLIARLLGVIGAPFPITALLVLLGTVGEYLAWTVGFGAVALMRFQKTV
jgi:hypothetical protein